MRAAVFTVRFVASVPALVTWTGQVQQMRDLLECVWPAVLDTAQLPFRSHTWIAGLAVVVDRDGGDLTRTRRLGAAHFEHAIRREITKRGGVKPCLRIVRELFAALADPAGVAAHRAEALKRVQLLLADWAHDQERLADTETTMVAVLDELKLTRLVCSISGISAVGADCKKELSGIFKGRIKLTGQGRPGLRLAAWRAVWAKMSSISVTPSGVPAAICLARPTHPSAFPVPPPGPCATKSGHDDVAHFRFVGAVTRADEAPGHFDLVSHAATLRPMAPVVGASRHLPQCVDEC